MRVMLPLETNDLPAKIFPAKIRAYCELAQSVEHN